MPARFVCLLLCGFALPGFAAEIPLPKTVEFNLHIRPILADKCFHCHGPDEKRREAELRFDEEAGAKADRDGKRAIVPGDLAKSLLYARITSKDADERMPPPDAERQLAEREIKLLARWIEQGAKWQDHWAFIPPRHAELPSTSNPAWQRNGIDAFVLARLDREGLKPRGEADRRKLIRRVTLDLTGLPPTPEEVQAFVMDKSPDAYEQVVDRLLASPRFGERMARPWLDAARYADTSGYQNDGPRYMWRWRDWVIEAYNRNMPFDEFTIEQLAGDLLPRPTLDQRIATGFNRNHRGNAEGGIIPEEFAVEYVVDRVETTCTVWLGLTMGCARCHDHKYDPFTQKDFYRLYAYFNSVPEFGRAIKEGNSPPYIKAPTREDQKQLALLAAEEKNAQRAFQSLHDRIESAQQAWEAKLATDQPLDWFPADKLLVRMKFDGNLNDAAGSAKLPKYESGEAAYAEGRFDQALELDGKGFVDLGDVAKFGYFDRFSFSAWVYPQGDGTILSRMKDTARADGYQVALAGGKVHVNLVKRWLDDSIRVETVAALKPNQWQHLAVTYDGSRVAKGIRVYINGQPQRLMVDLDLLNQSFVTDEPLRVGSGGGDQERFHGRLDEVRVFAGALSPDVVSILATPESINQIVALPTAERTTPQRDKLRAYFLAKAAPENIRRAYQRYVDAREHFARYSEHLPTVMVMQELPQPRQAHVLIRGQYDKPGETVTPDVLGTLAKRPAAAPNNRLALARWLVDPKHPLTARVAVNRYWELYFGTGLVKTSEDFGTQGEPPSHPLLLDWLATEFIQNGWNVKGMQRLIVTSATYRQSSLVTPELWAKDPENRLLARGPRQRMPAEMVRDQALALSGLLVERIGGPSVKPYQPDGLWKEIATDGDYDQDHGAALYRRSLYTYWKRTVAPPTMTTFDAPPRETCVIRRATTNTPLQALALMNETSFIEAARVMAARVIKEGGGSPESRLSYAFRLATAREPKPAEAKILSAALAHHLATYRENPKAAGQLLAVGEAERTSQLDAAELAAYAAVVSMILNLDEVITKE